MDQFSPLSDFENAIQDSLSEVSQLLHDLDVTEKEDDNELESKSNYRYYMDHARFSSAWKKAEWQGWRLPAQGEYDQYCQKWNFFGCNNTKQHPQNKHYCEHQLFQCKRSRCPKCIESWVNRQASRTTRRIKKHIKLHKSKFKSVVLSPPPDQVQNITYNSLKKWLSKTLKIANITTAVIIFHPFRFDKKKLVPYFSPHFHILTSSYLTNTTEFYNKTKWFIKNKGELETDIDVFNCVRYLFSHAGVKQHTHVIRYIGSISYRKLKIEKEPKSHHCPYCELPLVLFRLNPTIKCKPPPINHIGLWDKDAFTIVDMINDDGKIPFYDLIDEPKSTIDYLEYDIYSFELQLLQKTRLPQVQNTIREMNNIKCKTSLKCRTLDDFI